MQKKRLVAFIGHIKGRGLTNTDRGDIYTKFHLDQVIYKDRWGSKELGKCVLASTSEIKAG